MSTAVDADAGEFELHKVLARLDKRLGDIERRLDALAPGVDKMDRHVDFVESLLAWVWGGRGRITTSRCRGAPQQLEE